VWLHHVHDTMWKMTLPPRLARVGRAIEFQVAPRIYSGASIVTLSESSKQEIIEKLRLSAARILVVPPGIAPSFAPAGSRDPEPLVVAVGRLVPVKRFDLLIDALAAIKPSLPGLRAVIVGEGYERENLERQIEELRATDWIALPGHIEDAELLDLYRRAWVLASASAHEGWGMTITEAGACGTPSVATRIAGHEDAIVDGKTGLLVDDVVGLAAGVQHLITDDRLRSRLSDGAREYAARFTWGATACGTLQALADEALRHRSA
jgi:glycosyltransferase involved in cell wall biosynthesis